MPKPTTTTPEIAAPPPHLSDRAAEIWRSIITKPTSAGRLAVIQTALESLDRADQAKAQIEREGMTTTTKTTGAVHLHPLLRVERENRQLFARLFSELGLHFKYGIDDRKVRSDQL